MKAFKQILALLLAFTLLLGVCGVAEAPAAETEQAPAAESVEPAEELIEEPVEEPAEEELVEEEPAEEEPAEEEPAEEELTEEPEADAEVEESYEAEQLAEEPCPDGEHEFDYSEYVPIDEHTHGVKCRKCGYVEYWGSHYAFCTDPTTCAGCGGTCITDDIEHEHQSDEGNTYTYKDNLYHTWVCPDCQQTVELDHVITCDNPTYCKDCKQQVSDYPYVIHDWDYSNMRYDAQQHWYVCRKCSAESDKEEHLISCGDDSGKCVVCEAPYTGPNVDHIYDWSDWQYDETSHWHVCEKCGEKTDILDHWTDCRNPGVCEQCNAKGDFYINHDYESYYDGPVTGSDANKHWRTCKHCGAVKSEGHRTMCGDPEGICSDCGKPTSMIMHHYADDKTAGHNKYLHWYACDGCGTLLGFSEHYYPCTEKNATTCVVCGEPLRENTEPSHRYGPDLYKNNKLHYSVCADCGEIYESEHYVACDSKTPNKCEACGGTGTIEKIHMEITMKGTENRCLQVCVGCNTTIWDGDHYVTCYSDGRCISCSYKVSNPTTIHHHYEDGVCTYCGEEAKLECTSELTLTVKETSTLKPTSPDDSGFLYESSDPKIASITAKGKITAKAKGTATITVTGKQSGTTATCKVTVLPAPTKVNIAPLSKTDYSTDDAAFALTASLEPADALQSVTWTSSDKTVALVSDDGLVTLVGQGKAKITATSEKKGANGKKRSASVPITVQDPHLPASISIAENGSAPLYVNMGETLTLHADMKPVTEGQTVISGVTWSIPKKQQQYATIDPQTGELHAQNKEGSVTVTAKTDKKGGTGKTLKQLSATVKITVADPLKPRSVKINGGEKEIPFYYESGKTLTLQATIEPATATPGVTWSIPNSKHRSIATIDSATGVLTPTGTKFGIVTVKVATQAKKTNKKAAEATIKIAVLDPNVVDPKLPYNVTIIQEDGTELKDGVQLKAGEALKLSASILPETATEQTALTWSIPAKQQKYATVDTDGTVHGVKGGGSVTVTVQTANGKKDTVKIKIVK